MQFGIWREGKSLERIFDRIILFISCSLLLIMNLEKADSVAIFLVTLSISALNEAYSKTSVVKILYIAYPILCFIQPMFCIFVPLILYDVFLEKAYIISFLYAVILGWYINSNKNPYLLLLIFLVGLAYFLMKKTEENTRLSLEYKQLRDTSKELNMLLENKNKDLIEKQDYEIHLATLKERNRIAREIHDNVGHLLSRSILMMGAAIAINKDEHLSKGLDEIKNTLSNAMDNIRQSVHNLHDESIDLEAEINKIISEFHFCKVDYEYDMQPGANHNLKYSFITIIKEALSNVIKHSNATQVQIIVQEHPGMYQLLIEDDGTRFLPSSTEGIGLVNMKERVLGLMGTILITKEKGFRIFISVPKKGKALS